MTAFQRLFTLSPSEGRVLAMAVIVVALVRAALWLLPLGLLLRLLEKLEGSSPLREAREPAVDRVAWAIRAASRYVPKATCLTQALAGRLMLARRGVRATLRIGVTRSGQGIEGHAWLEREGRAVMGEAGLDRYAVLQPLDGSAA